MSTDHYEFDLTDGATKKAYLAVITGTHPKFKFSRDFINPDRREGRHKYYEISRTSNHVYEKREYSAKDNVHGGFYTFVDGKLSELTETQVAERFGLEAKEASIRKEGYQSEGFYKDETGIWWFCTKSSGFYTEDGLSFGLSQDEGWVEGDHHWARKATAKEVEEQEALRGKFTAESEAKKQTATAFKQLKEIARTVREQAVLPEGQVNPQGERIEFTSSFMNSLGDQFLLEEGQAIWILYYNGRSGDDWSYSNFGNWIAWRAAWNETLANEIRAFDAQKGTR